MIFDLIFLTIFVWAAYRGFTKGFIMQLVTFVALIAGIFCAIKFSGFLNEILIEKTTINQNYIPIITFVGIFLLIIIIVHLVGWIINKFIDAVALGFANRLFGAIFSITKYALILSALLAAINRANSYHHFLPDEKVDQSVLYGPLSQFAPSVFPYLNFEKAENLFNNPQQELQV